MNSARRIYRLYSRRYFRRLQAGNTATGIGSIALAFLLILSSGLAADLHRLAFHGLQPLAAHTRIGRYCALHGEGVRLVDQANATMLSDARAGLACPICAGGSYLPVGFAPPRATVTAIGFVRSAGTAPLQAALPATARIGAPHPRGPPLS